MAYRVPTFNLTCNISSSRLTGVDGIPEPPYREPAVPCQLTYGQRVQVVSTGGTTQAGVLTLTMNLLVPKGTDIRGPQDTDTYDLVEVPAETGRWYRVVGVDDIGKGFNNEHRTASIFALDGKWSAPYP